MINNQYFDIVFFFILLIHFIVLMDVKPKNTYIDKIQGSVYQKDNNNLIEKLGKIEGGNLFIFDSEYFTSATNVNIYSTNTIKKSLQTIYDKISQFYGFTFNRST